LKGEQAAVAAHIDGLAVKRVDGVAEPAVVMALEPDHLGDHFEWRDGEEVRDGAAEAISGGVLLHHVSGGVYGGGAGEDEGVGEVLGANDEVGLVARDGRGRESSVGGDVVAGLVGHGDGEVGSQRGDLNENPHEGVPAMFA